MASCSRWDEGGVENAATPMTEFIKDLAAITPHLHFSDIKTSITTPVNRNSTAHASLEDFARNDDSMAWRRN